MIINFLNRDGDKPHVVKLFHAAKHKKFSYMIVTLLGENLRTLKVIIFHFVSLNSARMNDLLQLISAMNLLRFHYQKIHQFILL